MRKSNRIVKHERILVLLLCLSWAGSIVHAFSVSTRATPTPSIVSRAVIAARHASTTLLAASDSEEEDFFDENNLDWVEDEEPAALDNMERAWRYAKKPLLRIGAKGATLTHGNSLRQLLEAHTAVKVKINTLKFGGNLENAFDTLKRLAEESGAPQDIELLQAREGDKIVLFGLPGTMEKIKSGEFPPVETKE